MNEEIDLSNVGCFNTHDPVSMKSVLNFSAIPFLISSHFTNSFKHSSNKLRFIPLSSKTVNSSIVNLIKYFLSSFWLSLNHLQQVFFCRIKYLLITVLAQNQL